MIPIAPVAIASLVSAQVTNGQPRVLRAHHVPEGSIRIDGLLSESAWQASESGTDFTQRDPADGSPATEKTEVRVLYSDAALYVAVRAFDSEPTRIITELSRRDTRAQSDEISVFVDSYFDRRTAFEFAVNPSGAIRDVYHQDEYSNDPSWDPVWQVATKVDSAGWTAEFRLPLTQLRYNPRETRWGFQVMRRIQRKAETDYWVPYSKNTNGLASQFGILDGLENLSQPRRIEARPYTVTSVRMREPRSVGAFSRATTIRLTAGADLKMGLTPNLTIDATVNPDFGQVEADPAIVNLTAFESFLPEKRPFFVEGSGLFATVLPVGEVFYSRRIGRSPQGYASPPPGGSVELPEKTRIIGAAKLTGRKVHGIGIGFMSIVTAEERAVLRDSLQQKVGTAPVEPLTNYVVARVERDFRGGSQTVGATLTGVNRRLPAELQFLRSSAYVGVLNGVHKWKSDAWAIRWNLAASNLRGSRAAITAAQRSSLRYYQRPDAPHLGLDTTRTALGGTSGMVSVGKEGGTWRYVAAADFTTPGFDVNELGFQWGADSWSIRPYAGYVRATPQGWFQDYQINFTGWRTWTTGNELIQTVFPFVYLGGTLRNNWTVQSNPMNLGFDRRCISCLRGGPSLRGDPVHVHYLRITTDQRKRFALSVGGFVVRSFRTSFDDLSSSTTLYWKLSETLNGSIATDYSRFVDPAQFVTSQVALDTTRYVLAKVRQTTGKLTMRLNWTATPQLSFEFYGQPYVSAGSYSGFNQAVNPGARSFGDRLAPLPGFSCSVAGTCSSDLNADGSPDLSFGRPDFRFSQLRSTSVLRWEYRPGSLVFVAWQHGRTGFRTDPAFGGRRAFTDLLKLRADNTVLVKANYWVSF